MDFQNHRDDDVRSHLEIDNVFLDFEELQDISNDEITDLCFLLNSEEEDVPEPSQNENLSLNQTLTDWSFPSESMEIDSQIIDLHLFMAYCEAMEKKRMVLADAISKHIIKKVNPSGKITERLLYYLFQTHNKQFDYLKRECTKNFFECFIAFYRLFPYEMFAHFAANSLILKAICHDTKVIHIFDFDIGNGVQWSSFVAVSQLQFKELRITSIKWSNAASWENDSFKYFTFDETKKRLCHHASALGVRLAMDELELRDFKKMKKRISNKREIYAFNCMVSLPQMMKGRNRKDVIEFTRVADQFACDYDHNVVITYGDGNVCENYQNQEGFCSFFEENLIHYKALLESMDHIFPKHLETAKIAMECLFVAPFVSSQAWIHNWEVQKELQWETVLEGFEVSEEILFECKLMVTQGDGLHQVTVEGDNKNQIALLWKNHPLVRVSCWKS